MPHAWSRPGCVPGLPRPAGAHPTMGVGLRHSKGAGATRVPGGCPIMLCAPRPCSGRGAGRRGAAPNSLPSRAREHRFLLNTEFLIATEEIT